MKTAMRKGFVLYKGMWSSKEGLPDSVFLTDAECKKMLMGGGKLVRNIYNWDKQTPSCFWYVIKDAYGGMEELPSKVRNQVKKSLRTYDFRKVSKEEMMSLGYELYNDSRKRFKDSGLLFTRDEWWARIKGENKELWLGIDKESGKPATFAINTLIDGYCDYTSMGISPDVPNNTYPMYGLIYEMNRYYLEEKKVSFVMDGARSITEHSNIQPFLEEKFKFRKAYCDLQLYYRSWVGIAVRVLYPFRKMIKSHRLTALLNMEAMARGNY